MIEKKKYKKVKQEFKQFRKFHNQMMDFVNIGFKTNEDNFKEIIENKVRLMDQLTDRQQQKLNKTIMRRLTRRFNPIIFNVKNFAKNNRLTLWIRKYSKWIIRILKVIGSLGLIQQIYNIFMQKGFTFEVLRSMFEICFNIFF